MSSVSPLFVSGAEVWPLIEGGKGIGVSTGQSSGAWASAGGVGTFSAVNADSYDADGNPIPQIYHARTRKDRHDELVKYAIDGGVAQAQIAHEISGGRGRLHVNVLWEMGGAERVLCGVLDRTRGIVHGVTCGAGMPYRIAEIAAKYGIYYYPIVSSGRAFNALWRRAYHKVSDWLGGVVYEDPWRAGGHNGLSNSENPDVPEDPYPRVAELRTLMNSVGLNTVPIIMAGGVWCIDDWSDWLDNPEIGPVAFQFGTRPLVTTESPISEVWKRKLITLKEGDVGLNRFSPTGFYSSAVRNRFIEELEQREQRQVAFTTEPIGDHSVESSYGMRGRTYYLTLGDNARVESWLAQGFDTALKTPDSTLIFVTKDRAREIRKDQADCMGCLSQCRFSNWAANPRGTTGKKADPRSFCIQKTLQDIIHGDDVDDQLMFSGHGAYRFADDPYYANGFIPTVAQLMERLLTGR
ncbi:MAG: nitronate monooxygenase [Alphaproteobacteria bacterium]|nr:nitronate monooxygenase [Alphaproteobacteria bacterium]